MEIDLSDVIRVTLQFLKEQGLSESAKSLQKETGIFLNTPTTAFDVLEDDIRQGKWDSVLSQLVQFTLSDELLSSVHEQIILELLEAGEQDLAKEMVRSLPPLQALKTRNAERYQFLSSLCRQSAFDAKIAYGSKTTKETRRNDISKQLHEELHILDSSRLLNLIQSGVQLQQQQGLLPSSGKIDLLRGIRKSAAMIGDDRIVYASCKAYSSSGGGKVQSATIAPNGQTLLLGLANGRLEFWSTDSFQPRIDLEYQGQGEFITHDAAVTCVIFSKESDYIAVGLASGEVKVWKISTGKCMRSFPLAHTAGVSSLCFSRDGTQLLSTSFDHSARVHGLKSGKTLREFRGHSSFVNGAVFLKDCVATASSDGTVKIWDAVTTESLLTVNVGMGHGSKISNQPIHTLLRVPESSCSNSGNELVFACCRGSIAVLLDESGQIRRQFTHNKHAGGADFVAASLSKNGHWAYCAGEDHNLYVFNVRSGELEDTIVLETTSEITQLVHHPTRRELAAVTLDGHVTIIAAD